MTSYGAGTLGMDPGAVSGGWAYIPEDGLPQVGDLDVVDKMVDAAALARMIALLSPRVIVVERVGAMPRQGVSSTFRFGKACGLIEGVIAASGIPLEHVTPVTWKKFFRLSADKEKARALAIKLFPRVEGLHLKRHHGRAEALLLAHYFISNQPKAFP